MPYGTPGRRSAPDRPIVPLEWPPALPDALQADLQGLRADHERVSAERASARKRLADLEGPLRQEAERKDEEASIAAIRAGKAIPAPKALEAWASEVEDARRALSRYDAAVAAIARDVVQVLADHEGDYAQAIAQERSEAASLALEAVESLSRSVAQVQALEGVAGWAAASGRKSPQVTRRGIVGKVRAEEALAAFRSWLEERTLSE